MTPCTALSDRMPEVALGRSRWSDEEARHLAACADCRAEWAVVRAGQALGASLPATDPAVTAARLRDRLAVERRRTRTRIVRATGLAAAAVLALAVWPRRGNQPVPAPMPRSTPIAAVPAPPADSSVVATGPFAAGDGDLPLPELDSLPAEALDSMLRVLDEPLAHVETDDLPPDDAGDQELAQALAGLEG